MNLNITTGWFPPALQLIALGLFVGSLGFRGAQWRRQLLWGIPIAIVLGLITYVANVDFDIIGNEIPVSLYVWIGLFWFAVAVGFISFFQRPWWSKLCSVFSIIVSLALAGTMINIHFGYYPTLKSLFGSTAQHDSSLPELAKIQEQVKKTGRLPSTGVTITLAIPPTLSHFHTSPAIVYIPPAWFATTTPHLPVLELFEGNPGNPADWIRAIDVDKVSNDFAATHQGEAPILVLADINAANQGDTECVNSTREGNAQTYLTKDIPNYITATFASMSASGGQNSGWGAVGFSAGGTCAAIVATTNPDAYSVFADYSGDSSPRYGDGPVATAQAYTIQQLFDGNAAAYFANDPKTLLANNTYMGMSAWFAVGDHDYQGYQEGVHTLYDLAKQPKVGMADVCLDVFAGGHEFYFWNRAFLYSYPWLVWRLHLTSTAPPVPGGAMCSAR